ncbi:transcription factor bHLH121-like isoform X2 [Wolffia australiana]
MVGEMDRWKPSDGFYQSAVPVEDLSPGNLVRPGEDACVQSSRLSTSSLDSSQKVEQGAKGCMSARKVQKADREKLRRDRLNEQFQELGNALDPSRPKNDKATILADTIQMLKDLTAQVDKLKSEYASLSEESSELSQEKNELREEKAALKSEIDTLNAQYQQRLRLVSPWATMDGSMVMAPPQPYPFPMPMPMSIPMHPPIQPYPFFPGQPPHGSVPSLFISSSYPANPHSSQPGNRSSGAEKVDNFNDVATELELKMPGSALPPSESPPRGQIFTSS